MEPRIGRICLEYDPPRIERATARDLGTLRRIYGAPGPIIALISARSKKENAIFSKRVGEEAMSVSIRGDERPSHGPVPGLGARERRLVLSFSAPGTRSSSRTGRGELIRRSRLLRGCSEPGQDRPRRPPAAKQLFFPYRLRCLPTERRPPTRRVSPPFRRRRGLRTSVVRAWRPGLTRSVGTSPPRTSPSR